MKREKRRSVSNARSERDARIRRSSHAHRKRPNMAKEKKTKQKVQELWEKSNENAGPRTRRVNRILLTVVVVLGVVAIAAAIVFIVILSGAVLHS